MSSSRSGTVSSLPESPQSNSPSSTVTLSSSLVSRFTESFTLSSGM
ncbi:unnamed protein product, partial [Ixodes pacificus]